MPPQLRQLFDKSEIDRGKMEKATKPVEFKRNQLQWLQAELDANLEWLDEQHGARTALELQLQDLSESVGKPPARKPMMEWAMVVNMLALKSP